MGPAEGSYEMMRWELLGKGLKTIPSQDGQLNERSEAVCRNSVEKQSNEKMSLYIHLLPHKLLLPCSLSRQAQHLKVVARDVEGV